MTPADLKAVLERTIAELPADELPVLLEMLAGATARAQHRLLSPPPANAAEQWVDAEKMAELLDVPVNWVRDKTRAGILPFHPLGHYIRYSPPEVFEALRKLPRRHDFAFCGPKKRKETRGGKRQVSTECPSSSADSAPARKAG